MVGSSEAKLLYIVLVMLICFTLIFLLISRIPASFFSRFFGS